MYENIRIYIKMHVASNKDLNPLKLWTTISKTSEQFFKIKIGPLTLDTIMNSMHLTCVNYKLDNHYMFRISPY